MSTSRLTRVTITGADKTTDIDHLVELTLLYPFVEWGILVSKRQEGSFRFPSRDWMQEFSAKARQYGLPVSMHLCGAWVRQLLRGDLSWGELPSVAGVCQRVQINTHAEVHETAWGGFQRVVSERPKSVAEFIFQADGVNDHFMAEARAMGVNASVLFDKSGGAGVLPVAWPEAIPGVSCGYAGGLGPYNVLEQLHAIEKVCPKGYWIDMERRVRTADDSALDLEAVRSVLEQAVIVVTA